MQEPADILHASRKIVAEAKRIPVGTPEKVWLERIIKWTTAKLTRFSHWKRLVSETFVLLVVQLLELENAELRSSQRCR